MNAKIKQCSRYWQGSVRNGGFTLVELMVALALAIVLLFVAVPSFRVMVENGRLTAVTNDFVTDAYLARREALTRGRRVTMCRCVGNAAGKCAETDGQFTCSQDNATNWDQGWLVFVDVDGDAQHDGPTAPIAEPVIRVHDRLPAQLDLIGSGVLADYVSYDRRGLSSQISGAMLMGDLKLRTTEGAILERCITIRPSGDVEAVKPPPESSTCP